MSLPATALVEQSHLYVRRWFAQRMPKRMRFHDLEHTLSVVRSAMNIGTGMRVPAEDLALLEIAALFHDTGYASVYEGHEAKSADIAAAFLTKQGATKAVVQKVRALILATKPGSVVRTPLQAILRDADSSKAGQGDFEKRSELLRMEWQVVKGAPIDEAQWAKTNLKYLSAHRFYTPYARKRYGPQKKLNLVQLRKKVSGAQPSAAPIARKDPWMERDLSWLSFNDRVLQEAQDARNPLLERVKFLAIYSSNLDEFYRVRVASLRSLVKLKRKVRSVLDLPPAKLIERINRKALAQQRKFGALWRGTLLPELARKGIHILDETKLTSAQQAFAKKWFKERVAPLLNTANVRAANAPFIEDRKLYFVCRIKPLGKGASKDRSVLVNIPSDDVGRFVLLPSRKGRTDILFLDDLMRLCLPDLFTGHRIVHCHSIKLSRDAELHLDEEFIGNVKEKVSKSLRKRRTGVPSRFLYDAEMPKGTVRELKALLGLGKPDMVPGGRYHNFSDLMKLPVEGHPSLRDTPWPALPLMRSRTKDLFAAISRKDLLLHTPYHDFSAFLGWIERAAKDPAVKHIRMTLYRVATSSAVCTALLNALDKGKRVTVFVEVQARFDEGTNLYWGERLEQAGARVLYSYENLKVHCKLCCIDRTENGKLVRYAYLGTGNFNERTATLYADSALMTKRLVITREVNEVFKHLADRRHKPHLTQLLMAPLFLRNRIEDLIDKEIENAVRGRPASLLVKVNSLEDRALIAKLYDADRAGVKVRLIVRGICCLVTGIVGASEHIEAISLVDRYLEHTRAFVFHNNGDPLVYLSSADWMGRNLDRRIEVAFPIQDPDLRKEVMDMLELQWRDNVKARLLNSVQDNPYRKAARAEARVQAQQAIHAMLAARTR